MRKHNQSGSATAELVVALPIIITLVLIGARFMGNTMHHERLRYFAEGVVQAVMRDENEELIKREISRALPGARLNISSEPIEGIFTVVISQGGVSVASQGFR